MRATALLAPVPLLVLVVAGCLRGDPLDWTVSAKDSRALALWRAKVDTAIGPENRRRLDEALQELRANIAGHRELNRWSSDNAAAGGKEAIDAAVCARIDGRPLRDVLQHGYEFRVQRLQQEFAGLENAVKQNTRLVTRPDDVDSRDYLERFHVRQRARLETYRVALEAAERELQPLVKASGRRFLEPVPRDTLGEMPVRIR